MNRTCGLLAVLLLLAAVVAAPVVPAGADVPEARLVISEVSVAPEEPTPGNTTTVEFTVENSAGSATGVAVDRVALRGRSESADVHAEATGLGALSVGDGVTLELATAFEEAGVHDLELVVEATDEDGTLVEVTRPVTVVVGGVDAAGVTDDVQVDARLVHPSELDDEEQPAVDLGASGLLEDEEEDPQLRTPLVRVEVTNFGTATARDVVVEPTVESGSEAGPGSLPRLAVDDVAPGDAESVLLDAGEFDEPATLAFEATYTLGTERSRSETALEYRPNRGELAVTDVDMRIEDGRLLVTGNAANRGLGEVHGAVIRVGDTDHVDPAYPGRSYFVGTVPESEFARFDLVAEVDRANATTVPVTVSYLADGRPYERTVELEYEPRPSEEGDDGGSGVSLAVAAVVGAIAFVGVAALGWRRYRGRG